LSKRPVKAAPVSPSAKKTAAAKAPAKSLEPTPAEQAQLQFPGDFSNDTQLAPHGNDWVLTQPPGNFTLQLLTSVRERDVMAYLKHHELKHMMAYCRYSERGQVIYSLLYGSFSSSEHAHEAEADLPESLRVGAIFARRYANLQGLIKPR
jgi:septal ring-binding cell division protein DamX